MNGVMEKGCALGLSERIDMGWGSGPVWGWGDSLGEDWPGREAGARAWGADSSGAPPDQHPTLGSGGREQTSPGPREASPPLLWDLSEGPRPLWHLPRPVLDLRKGIEIGRPGTHFSSGKRSADTFSKHLSLVTVCGQE